MSYFRERITCALNNSHSEFSLLSVFPGDTWSNFEPLQNLQCKVPLSFHSFCAIENYLNPGLGIGVAGKPNYRFEKRAVEEDSQWCFDNVEVPAIKFVEAVYDRVPTESSKVKGVNDLAIGCYKLIDREMRNIDQIFDLVRNAWSNVSHKSYSKLSLQLSSKIFSFLFS